MRYFKYDGPMVDIELLKKRHRELSEDGKKARRRANWLHRLGTVVFVLVSLAVFAGLLFLILRFRPRSDGIVWQILDWICGIVLTGVSVILSAIIGVLAAAPLWNRYGKSGPKIRKNGA